MRISTQLLNQLGVNGILNQQGALSRIQSSIASGKKITSPADDPSGSAQIIRLSQAQSQVEQYQRNSTQAVNRLNLEDTVLTDIENALTRVRELAIQANNATMDNNDRHAIAQEVRSRLDQIYSLANTRDANGEYLFSGFQLSQKPFTSLANGSYSYNSDQGQRMIQISQERRVADSDSGYGVFMDIPTGNGSFQTEAGPTNTGTGVVDLGAIADYSSYVADTYTITMVNNGSGKLGYNIIGLASGQVIPPPPQNATANAPDFSSGASISFNGIETKITGTPGVGDTFIISPAGKRGMFATLNNLATALESNAQWPTDVAKISNTIARSIQDIDNSFNNVLQYRSKVGARLNTIDDQKSLNDAFLIELKSTTSQLQDLDMVSAISELQTRSIALQAAQASFKQIQGLSVFNYF